MILIAVSLFSASASVAKAESAYSTETHFGDSLQDTRVWLDLDAQLLGGPSELVLPMAVNGQVMVHPNWAIDFSLPWSVVQIGTNQPQASWQAGNIELGIHAVGTAWEGQYSSVTLWAGVSIDVPSGLNRSPLSSPVISNAEFAQTTFELLVNESLAGSSTDRYFPSLGVRVPAGLDYFQEGRMRYRLELDQDYFEAGAYFINFMASVESARVEPSGVIVGARGIMNGLFSSASFEGSLGIEPYVAWYPKPNDTLYLRVGLLLGVDYGTSFLMTLTTQFGYKF